MDAMGRKDRKRTLVSDARHMFSGPLLLAQLQKDILDKVHWSFFIESPLNHSLFGTLPQTLFKSRNLRSQMLAKLKDKTWFSEISQKNYFSTSLSDKLFIVPVSIYQQDDKDSNYSLKIKVKR